MDAQEKEEVLRFSNGVEESYEVLETIHGWFAEQVSRTPDQLRFLAKLSDLSNMSGLSDGSV